MGDTKSIFDVLPVRRSGDNFCPYPHKMAAAAPGGAGSQQFAEWAMIFSVAALGGSELSAEPAVSGSPSGR
jgi:hypothetical protein